MKSKKHTPKRVKYYIYNSVMLSLLGKLRAEGLSPTGRALRPIMKQQRYAHMYGAGSRVILSSYPDTINPEDYRSLHHYLIQSMDFAKLEQRVLALYNGCGE